MSTALPKQYNPSEVEQRWVRAWLDAGYFHADDASPTVPYAITLPPPNVTGSLHMGHALGSTMQDILIRWRRMQSYNAMWMPGVDHASIAVHHLLEKDLKRRDKKTRFDLGRDEFMRRAWAWKEKSGSRISEQERLMGFSLDWVRERFTMDEVSNRAVREAFVKLYEQGLIYRGKRMINWDPVSRDRGVRPRGQRRRGKRPHVGDALSRWPRAAARSWWPPPGPRPCSATPRWPCTPRTSATPRWWASSVRLPLTDRRIPIVADSFVDKTFGSGAVKITPAHDPNDYECSAAPRPADPRDHRRKGKLCAPAPAKYVGLLVDACRKQVVADLEAAGFLVSVKDHKMPRGRSERSGAVIEPMLMEQWFVKTASLAAGAVAAVETGKTKFVPSCGPRRSCTG
jgi:valyl-tRNA synthetase